MLTEPREGHSPLVAEQEDSVAVVREALSAMSAGRRIDDADEAVSAAMETLTSRLASYANSEPHHEANGLPVQFSPQALALRAALEANRT